MESKRCCLLFVYSCGCCCRGGGGNGGGGSGGGGDCGVSGGLEGIGGTSGGGGGGGHDSAFNSGGTPTVICEFGAVGSTSLPSMTSEGQDSALALSEAKEDSTPDIPTAPQASSILHEAPGTFRSMVILLLSF